MAIDHRARRARAIDIGQACKDVDTPEKLAQTEKHYGPVPSGSGRS